MRIASWVCVRVGGRIRYYGIPLLDQHLGDECVDNFRQLSRIFSLATQRLIKETELVTLDELTANFVRSYERLYYRREPKRLPVFSVNIHYLVHLASHIRGCRPMRYCWQYPMERYCGIIKPIMARSKSQLSSPWDQNNTFLLAPRELGVFLSTHF
jgi:hypothetical protein